MKNPDPDVKAAHVCPSCGKIIVAPVAARLTCANKGHSECDMIISDEPIFGVKKTK